MNEPRIKIDDPLYMVNLERYPIDDLSRPAGTSFAQDCRNAYQTTGLCMLPDFIRPDALSQLAAEANALSDRAYFCKSTHNAYLTDANNLAGDSAAHHHQEDTFVGSIAYDLIPDHAALRKLYQWDPLRDFIAAVLGKTELHRFADPFGACSINVYRDGGAHGWHFDESEFTVTLMLQPPDHGGAFEYLPKLRGRPNEEECVARVLDGDRDGVIDLPFSAGALLIFGGNQTIHRVTQVSGSRLRLVPVLCYAEQPGLTNSPEVQRLFWGRTAIT